MSDAITPIITQTSPSLLGQPQVSLRKNDFEAIIHQKGVDVWHDRAIKCPCSSKQGAAPQSKCKNCGGAGWFYINRTETRMVVQSMNVATKLKDWSEEKIGTATITARDVDRLSFMDRITILDSESEYSQVVFLIPRPDSTELYGTLRYDPIKIYSVFLYKSVDEKHQLLKEGTDYTVVRNQIRLIGIGQDIEDPSISVRYTHRGEYTVMDISRDIMVTSIKDSKTNKSKDVQFPISAVGRRTHYMLDRNDYTDGNLLDNSFTTKKCELP